MNAADFQTGSLADGLPLVVSIGGAKPPITVTLNSTATARRIEISTNGVNWLRPAYDAVSSTMIALVMDAPMAGVRLTGQVGDIWSIR